jgi:phosphoserine phosphatase RsbU/P
MDSKLIDVLLIEDDVVDQMAFKRLVKTKELPYNYTIADSVATARDVLSTNKYDVILADYNLGDGTAFDLFDLVLDTPLIFVTGGGDEQIAVRALKEGAKDYLIKDSERSYLHLLHITVQQVVKHQRMEEAQKKAENEIKMLFTAVEQSSASVVITDTEGVIEYVNPKFVEVTGYQSAEILGQNPRLLKTNFHDQDYYKNLWDTVKSGKTWTGEFLNKKKSGIYFWEMASIAPVLDVDGNMTHLIAIKEDVTEQKKISGALEFKVKIEELINSISTRFINITTDDLDAEVNNSLKLLGEFIEVERAYILIFDPKHLNLKRTHYWHGDDINPDLLKMENLDIQEIPWVMEQLMTMELIMIPSLERLHKEAKKERKVFEENSVKSLLLLPMVYEQNLMGVIGLDTVNDEKYWESDTIKLLQIVGEIIVNALQRKIAAEKIENLYSALKQEIELASSVQTYLIPQWLRHEGNIMFSSIYTPSIDIGGDLFDILKISDNKYVLYVGDISGHGVKAALMMTAVKSIIGMLIEGEKENLSPHNIIHRLNKILCGKLFHDDYMTILLCVVDLEEKEIRMLNAGHPSLMEYDMQTKEVKILGKNGSIPVGWMKNHNYTEKDEDVASFDEDKIYLLYTDGIFECENNDGDQLGMEGFQSFVEKQTNVQNCLTLPYKFKQNLIDNNYDISTDDFTMLTFQTSPTKGNSKFKKIFILNSLLKNTGPIGHECFEIILEHFSNDQLATKVELVFNEYMNNIIEHGLQLRKDTVLAFQLEITDVITMTFWDRGSDWEIPEKSNEDIASLDKFRGMGIQIILSQITKLTKNRFDEINEAIIEFDPEKFKDEI